MQFKKLTFAALIIPAIMLLAGCANIAEKATEKAVENATGVKVDKQGDSVKIKTDKGEAEFSASENKVPDDFPEAFPLYDGAKVTGSMKTEAEGKKNFTVTFETSDDKTQVANFFKESLPKNGYKIETTMEIGDTVNLALKQGDTEVGGVTIAKDDKNKTTIIVSLKE